MEFCIDAAQLRAALAEIEAAEKNGFLHCLAVFKFSHAGYMLSDCRATYADLLERAHPTSASLNWGRFQGVSKRHTFKDGELVPLPADGVPASAPTQREKDLALLVKRLCRRLAPDDNLREGTTDYLRREGLLGSPLRADESGVKEDGNG